MRQDLKVFGVFLLLLSASGAQADNWPNWRGPHQNGSADGDRYPTTWSPTENIAWRYPLEGRGASTPAIWGPRIFLTMAADDKNVAVCLNREGEKQWQVQLGDCAGR